MSDKEWTVLREQYNDLERTVLRLCAAMDRLERIVDANRLLLTTDQRPAVSAPPPAAKGIPDPMFDWDRVSVSTDQPVIVEGSP